MREVTGLSENQKESGIPESQAGAKLATFPAPPRGSAAPEGTTALPDKSAAPTLVTRHKVGFGKGCLWTLKRENGPSPAIRMGLAAGRVGDVSTLLGCKRQIYELFLLNSDMDF